MIHRPPELIMLDAAWDVVIGLSSVACPVDPDMLGQTVVRNMAARLTNEASPETLLAMLASIGGPKTLSEAAQQAIACREKSQAKISYQRGAVT